MITADLSDKVVIVTGGASGIGYAAARMFGGSGAAVALNDISEAALAESVARLQAEGIRAIAAPGNVAREEEARAMVGRAVEAFGRLDFLLNNAGTPATARPVPPSALDDISDEMWDAILSVNLVGAFRVARAAVPHLRRAGGAIVNTSSAAAFTVPGSSLAYAASKAALVRMTRDLAKGLGPEIRVNAVAPGFIRTPWTARFAGGWEERGVAMTSLKRAGTPEDVAELMLFLCAGAGFITGQTILIDGGVL